MGWVFVGRDTPSPDYFGEDSLLYFLSGGIAGQVAIRAAGAYRASISANDGKLASTVGLTWTILPPQEMNHTLFLPIILRE